MFHPFEIAFCGLSGSGKTTLVTRVLRSFRDAGHEPAYFKHGCHHVDIDREGKDSFRARQAGALSVMVADPVKEALISETHGLLSSSSLLLERDMLFIEGLKELAIPKLLLVDADRSILTRLEDGSVSQVIALVHNGQAEGLERFGLPLVCRDDVDGVTRLVSNHFSAQVAATPVFGLVLAGGFSTRMGRDKALINYGEATQLERTASLLSAHCGEVFVSCRREQSPAYAAFGLPIIEDCYLGLGPLGGLLSAQRARPDAAWLVAACDLPFIDKVDVASLLEGRDPFRFSTAFVHPGSRIPEPLLTLYEPKSFRRLLERHASGNDSLCSFLKQSRISAIDPPGSATLVNANDPGAAQEAGASLSGGGAA